MEFMTFAPSAPQTTPPIESSVTQLIATPQAQILGVITDLSLSLLPDTQPGHPIGYPFKMYLESFLLITSLLPPGLNPGV